MAALLSHLESPLVLFSLFFFDSGVVSSNRLGGGGGGGGGMFRSLSVGGKLARIFHFNIEASR